MGQLRVIINGVIFEEPEGYDSTLNLHAKMKVNGLYNLAYEVERVNSVIYLDNRLTQFHSDDVRQCTIIDHRGNKALFDMMEFICEDGDLWRCTVSYIPTDKQITDTFNRALIALGDNLPIMKTQVFTIHGGWSE